MSLDELKLPYAIKKKIQAAEDYPSYFNRNQLAIACGVSVGTINNWVTSKQLPSLDLQIGTKKWWLLETVANFINEYRKKQPA